MAAIIPRLHLPMLQSAELIPHLGKGEEHWKVGRSAHSLCTLWHAANGIPASVKTVLQTSPALEGLGLVDGFMERLVDLGDGRQPSQTDLMAVCADQRGLVVMAVEGKVDETFGKHVGKWRDGSPTKEARLKRLCTLLGLNIDAVAPLRYQLLHRTASAMLEARRYRTSRAALLVHSFCPLNSGFDDFSQFVRAMGFPAPAVNRMLEPRLVSGHELSVGWVAERLPAEAPVSLDRM